MPAAEKSPNKVYVEHLERGELGYQFSPEAGKAVFYPRVLCPFTGSTKLEWRVSKGLGHRLRHHRRAPRRRRALQRRADRLRRGLPPDEPRGGHRPEQGEDRPARALPRASPWRRERPIPSVRAGGGRVMEGLKRASAAIVGVAESDLGHVADGLSVIDLMAQGSASRPRRLRAEVEGRRRPVLGDHAEPLVGGGAAPSTWGSTRASPARPSSAAPRSSTTSPTPWPRSSRACATSRSSPTAARSAASAASRPPCARSTPTRSPYKPFMPSTAYALAASRHMHQFGTTREQMAAVAVAAREWALLNPGGLGEEAAHDRGRARRAHGELSVHGARLLPRHRRRRRRHRHLGRARPAR